MVVYEVKTSSRQKKNNKLRWLATDVNFNCYTLGVLSLMVKQKLKTGKTNKAEKDILSY